LLLLLLPPPLLPPPLLLLLLPPAQLLPFTSQESLTQAPAGLLLPSGNST
jgi:hypothetical protein